MGSSLQVYFLQILPNEKIYILLKDIFKHNKTTRILHSSPTIQRALEATQLSYENKSQDDNSEIGLESRQPKLERVATEFQEKCLQEESRYHKSNCVVKNLLTFKAKLIALKLQINLSL